MRLIAMIPLEQVVTYDIIAPGYTFVVSQGYLKIYKHTNAWYVPNKQVRR